MVKQNEILINKHGASMKTDNSKHATWQEYIKEHMLSLDYTLTVKSLKHGLQQLFTDGTHKFTFEYYHTGRIVIKSSHHDKLQIIFLEKHEQILGEKLNINDSRKAGKNSFLTSTQNDSSSCASFSKLAQHDFTKVRENEKILEKYEHELISQKDLIESLSNEISNLRSEMTELKKLFFETQKCITDDNENLKQEIENKEKLKRDTELNKNYIFENKHFSEKITSSNNKIDIIEYETKHVKEKMSNLEGIINTIQNDTATIHSSHKNRCHSKGKQTAYNRIRTTCPITR